MQDAHTLMATQLATNTVILVFLLLRGFLLRYGQHMRPRATSSHPQLKGPHKKEWMNPYPQLKEPHAAWMSPSPVKMAENG